MKAWLGCTPREAKITSGLGLPCLLPINNFSQLYLILKLRSWSSDMLVR